MKREEFLKNHLNVWWLRPESALWDAIASTVISRFEIKSPSVDLGCGNGIFSFITAGGSFSLDYDWFKNVSLTRNDIYDAKVVNPLPYIKKKPTYKFDWGVDIKTNLLRQAMELNFYKNLMRYNLNRPLPFADESFTTVFSNVLYWLRDPPTVLKEIFRVLRHSGNAILCVPNPRFYYYCPSYRWKDEIGTKKKLMKIINMERYRHIQHIFTFRQFAFLAKQAGFYKIKCVPYLSPYTLRFWDVGLRPLSRPLIRMANMLKESERRRIKKEWIKICYPYLKLLYEMEFECKNKKGFYLFVLEKK